MFWRLTLREIDVIFKGHVEAQKRERVRTYQTAQLIGLAMNNPKKFPKLETFVGVKRKPQHDPEGVHALLLALANRGK